MLNLETFEIPLEGKHLVEASAGTGKTYNITSLFIRCLVEQRAEIDQILVLTYTKAATAELRERILSRLRDAIGVLKSGEAPKSDEFLNQLLDSVGERGEAASLLERGLHDFDETPIFTIHGFCQRVLQERSFLSGILYDSELVPDDSEFIQESADDWWRNQIERAEGSDTERVWHHILKEEGYLPDRLAKIVSTGTGKPYLHLSAVPPAGNDRRQELKELLHLFNELKDTWPTDGEEIEQLLLSEAVNGNRYQKNSVPTWIADINGWLDHPMPSLNLPHRFDRFSIGFIRTSGTRKGYESPDHPFFHAVQAFIAQAERVRSWLPRFKKEFLEYVRQSVRERKLSEGVLGYDDLLVMLLEALEKNQSGPVLAGLLRKKYPVALVDEFQDTDPVQYRILERIYGDEIPGSGLFLIGDPKQSIYSFRGADVFSYLRARSDVRKERMYGLGRNFRSDPDLIDAVNAIFGRLEHPFMVDEIRFTPAEPGTKEVPALREQGTKTPPIQFLESPHRQEDDPPGKGEATVRAAHLTAESISRLLNHGDEGTATIGEKSVRASDVAVLVRTHRQGEKIRETLETRGIKSVQYSEKSVYDTDEAGDLLLLLKAVAEPQNERLIRAALSTELFSHTAHNLIQLEENSTRWSDIMDRFHYWNRIWQEQGFIPMFRTFLRDSGVERHMISIERGERKLTNTLQLGELLQAREQEKPGGPFELIKWLVQKRAEPDTSAEEEQLRLESDEELVKIVTMHRSKGLEYPVVYCPFLWDGSRFSDRGDPFLYHDEDQNYRASLELNEKDEPVRDLHRFWAAKEELSENLRLAYVAMTRARQQCTIVFEPAAGMQYSPLGYLLSGKSHVVNLLKQKIGIDRENSSSPLPSTADYRRVLERLLSDNGSLFGRVSVDEQEMTRCRASFKTTGADMGPIDFSGRREIRSRSVVSSFSSIMHPEAGIGTVDEPEDEFFFPMEFEPDTASQELTKYGFPRGPQAGTCLHSIFEEISFDDTDVRSEVVAENLRRHGFDKRWAGVVEAMVGTVMNYSLEPGLQLNGIGEEHLVREMEFFFDLEPFTRRELIRLARRRDNGFSGRDLRVAEGFMKGYIDLVFQHDGRYYLLDYKSNYLGDRPSDYNRGRLEEEMENAGYDIQYHIYSVALNRYLSRRIPDYSCERHFGGVFYLFIRGMESDGSKGGIFFDRPSARKIDRLDALFGKEGVR